jgi:hypothetical protein
VVGDQWARTEEFRASWEEGPRFWSAPDSAAQGVNGVLRTPEGGRYRVCAYPLAGGKWQVRIGAWTLVLATSAVAAITGHDRCTRAALGVLAVVQVMGIATSIADGVPMGRQFWQVGSAGLICGWCAAMLASPLRSVPTREWTPHA